MNHIEFGAKGEALAMNYVKRLGWRILGRNIRMGRDELDITAMDGEELVVVEVRTRKIGVLAPPELTVGPRKMRSLLRASRKYVDRIAFEGNWRIDIVAVTESRDGEIEVTLFRDVGTDMDGDFT